MRTPALIAGCLALTGCVQTTATGGADRDAARALMVEELVSSDNLPTEVADAGATCALDRMSDAQVRDLLAATDDNQRGAVMRTIEDEAGFLTCLIEVGAFDPTSF